MRVTLPKRFNAYGRIGPKKTGKRFYLACGRDRRVKVVWDEQPTETEMERVTAALARGGWLKKCRGLKHGR